MFILKKIFSVFCMPLSWAMLLLLACIILIKKNSKRASVICAGISLGVLYLTSLTPVANLIQAPLEKQYPRLTELPNNVHTVVVLGGGNIGMEANNASLARVVEGIHLVRQAQARHQRIQLILSGGALVKPTSAQAMMGVALRMGIKRSEILLENTSLDTAEEAQKLQPILTNQRFALVTSAIHMPRSMALFKKQRMHPIAAPTQFTDQIHEDIGIKNLLPLAGNLARTTAAWHEYLGRIWARINGQAGL